MKMSITRVDPLSIEIPKKPPHKSASEHRRATKPIMEKRRRARINHSLDQIKALVLVGLNKDPAKHTKLEKADILEMTVEYLKDLVQVESIKSVQSMSKSSVIKSLKSGFNECASEVERFVDTDPNMDCAMKRRLKSQLKSNFSSLYINNLVSSTTSSSTGQPSSPTLSPLNMKTEPISPAAINRDALTTLSFNYNNSSTQNSPKSQSQLTPPPSANSSSEFFRFSPVHFAHSLHHPQYHQSHYISLPSPSSQYDDGMDCAPVDCSKSSKLNLDDNVWRPW